MPEWRKPPFINNGQIRPSRELQPLFNNENLRHFREFAMVKNEGGLKIGDTIVPHTEATEEICVHWCKRCHAKGNIQYDLRYLSKTSRMNWIYARVHLVSCHACFEYIEREANKKPAANYEPLDAALSIVNEAKGIGGAAKNEQFKADFLNKLRVLNKARVSLPTRDQVQAYADGQQRITQSFDGTDIVQQRRRSFNEDLVAAFVRCNVPLHVLQNSAMKQFLVNYIDPKFLLKFDYSSKKPSDKVEGLMSYTWMRTKGVETFDDKLDLRVYRGLRDECFYKQSMITIVVDGWSNKRCKSFLNICAVMPKLELEFFLGTVEVPAKVNGKGGETGEWVASKVINSKLSTLPCGRRWKTWQTYPQRD